MAPKCNLVLLLATLQGKMSATTAKEDKAVDEDAADVRAAQRTMEPSQIQVPPARVTVACGPGWGRPARHLTLARVFLASTLAQADITAPRAARRKERKTANRAARADEAANHLQRAVAAAAEEQRAKLIADAQRLKEAQAKRRKEEEEKAAERCKLRTERREAARRAEADRLDAEKELRKALNVARTESAKVRNFRPWCGRPAHEGLCWLLRPAGHVRAATLALPPRNAATRGTRTQVRGKKLNERFKRRLPRCTFPATRVRNRRGKCEPCDGRAALHARARPPLRLSRSRQRQRRAPCVRASPPTLQNTIWKPTEDGADGSKEDGSKKDASKKDAKRKHRRVAGARRHCVRRAPPPRRPPPATDPAVLQ